MSKHKIHHIAPWGEVLSGKSCLENGLQFFHVSPNPLQTQTVIESENFKNRPHYELFRKPPQRQYLDNPRFLSDRKLEKVFEQIRQKVNPLAPSREKSLFTFICRDCAIWFCNRSRKNGFVYEVLPALDSKVFVSDLVWRNVAANTILKSAWKKNDYPFSVKSEIEALKVIAKLYWEGENPVEYSLSCNRPEALILGQIVTC